MKKVKKNKNIAIFCGSKLGNNTIYKKEISVMTTMLSDNGFNIIYGGGKIGLMGIIYKIYTKLNSKIIGIIPKFLNKPEIRQQNTKTLQVVNSLHQRKILMIKKADFFIILPGGFGTLDELFEILTLNQLNLFNKKVIIFNISNYWKNLKLLIKTMHKQGFLYRQDINNIIWVNNNNHLKKILNKLS
tara:strand:+ start:42 stop:602 length:561 start_codon:yes stop_codon:yes gene_type:complete